MNVIDVVKWLISPGMCCHTLQILSFKKFQVVEPIDKQQILLEIYVYVGVCMDVSNSPGFKLWSLILFSLTLSYSKLAPSTSHTTNILIGPIHESKCLNNTYVIIQIPCLEQDVTLGQFVKSGFNSVFLLIDWLLSQV